MELLELLTAPAIVVAHQLGCLGELVAIEATGEGVITVAADVFCRVGPSHEDAHGGLGVGLGACYLPTKRILVGHGCTTAGVHIVLARTATTDDDFDGIGLGRRLGIGSRGQTGVCRLDCSVALGQLCSDAVEVGLRVETAGMDKAAVGVVTGGLCAGGEGLLQYCCKQDEEDSGLHYYYVLCLVLFVGLTSHNVAFEVEGARTDEDVVDAEAVDAVVLVPVVYA